MHHFSALTWLQRLCGPRHAEEPPSTGRQRYPAQPERNTDGMRVLHQREQPEYQPEPERPMRQWIAQQPEVHWRYAELTKTGPRARYVAGHWQKIIPEYGGYTPPGEALKRVTGPHTPIPATPAPEARNLTPQELPAFLASKVPGMPSGALPVERNLLATMRVRDRYELPSVGELPTTPTTHEAILSTLLPPLGPWDPAPEPTSPPPDWLVEDGPQVEFGTLPEVEAETDGEIPTQKLVPELRYTMQNAPTQPDEFPALRQLVRLARQKKESEK